MSRTGFDLTEFDELIKQFELMGGDSEELAKKVISSAVDVGMETYKDNIPVGDQNNAQGRARDNLKIMGIRKGKNGSFFRKITFNGDRGYLYMLDNGTSKTLPKPWREKAGLAFRNATAPIMRDTLIKEINKHLGE